MKKSYRLLGIDWDHKDYESPDIIEKSVVERNYKVERDLFDLPYYARSIKISEVMGEKTEQLNLILDKMIWCDEVQLFIENEPQVNTPVVSLFYYKRLGQIYSYVKDYLKNVKISIVRCC